jgi:hypothetical protein
MERSPIYAFVGAGCAMRLRGEEVSPVGLNFFGSPAYKATFAPCMELGVGSSVPISQSSFVTFSIWVNINAMQPFVVGMLSLGTTL